MVDYATQYRTVRETLSAEVLESGPQGWARIVPATPEWTVHDVVAHLTGIAADVNAGNIDGVGTDAWTAAQVEPRREVDLPSVIGEWERGSSALEAALPGLPDFAGQMLVADVISHALDVQGALGSTSLREHPSVTTALGQFAIAARQKWKAAGLPRLRVVAGDAVAEQAVWGKDDEPGYVQGSAFELLRATTGRRSESQQRRLDWSTDPEPYLDGLAAYPRRDTDLLE